MKKIIFLILISTKLFAQLPNTDIWLLDIKAGKDTIILSNPVNITHRVGYDNQPSFSPDGNSILYTSIRDEKQSDIYTYNIRTKTTTQFCNTPTTSEYSPNFTPDGKNISVVMVEPDSTQRLWEFPLKGGGPKLVMDKVDSIGYYCWINKDSLALIMITEPPTLEMVNVKKQKPKIYAKNAGRCIQLLPNTSPAGFLYMSKLTANDSVFKLFTSTVKKGREDGGFLIGLGKNIEDYAPMNFTYGPAIFFGRNTYIHSIGYQSLNLISSADLSKYGIKKITRIAISPDGKKMAIVAE